MPNVNRQPLSRGRWLLHWDSENIVYGTPDAAGFRIDLRSVRSPLDVIEELHVAEQKAFTSTKDICLLIDLIRIYLRERR
jgi:hypothetical protein